MFMERKQPETVEQVAKFTDIHFRLSQISGQTRNNGVVTQRAPGVGPPRFNGRCHSTFKGSALNGPRQPGLRATTASEAVGRQ